MTQRYKPLKITFAFFSSIFCTISSFVLFIALLSGEITFWGREINLLECINLILKIVDFIPENAFYYISCVIVGIVYIFFIALFVKSTIRVLLSLKLVFQNLRNLDNLYIAHDSILSHHNDSLYQLIAFTMICSLFNKISISEEMKYVLLFGFGAYLFALICDDVFVGVKGLIACWDMLRVTVIAILTLFSMDILNTASLQRLFSISSALKSLTTGTVNNRTVTHILYRYGVEPILVATLIILSICIAYTALSKYKHYKYEEVSLSKILKVTAIFSAIVCVAAGIIPIYCTSNVANINFTADILLQGLDLIKSSFLPLLMLLVSAYVINANFPAMDKQYKKATK